MLLLRKRRICDMVRRLDAASRVFAEVTAKFLGTDLSQTPGAGAAGGLGFAFLAYIKGSLQSGIQIVLNSIHLAEAIQDADYVVTGEGCLDAQTAMGKAPIGVAKLAKKYGAKVIALAGCTTDDAKACNKHERQGLRVVDDIETLLDPAGKTSNLMLTYAVRDGIISHCGEMKQTVLRPRKEYVDLNEVERAGEFEPYT